jgi:HAD superfamily hydrolase (TIGR01493 family)
VLEDLGELFGADVSRGEAEAFAGSVKDWPAFPDSSAGLAYLQRHYKLVIVSNVDRASFRHSNNRLGVTFDAVVTADDAGAYKPALNHFQLALAQLAEMGVPKDRVLHVAQSLYHDHVPAKRLGLSTIWVNRRAGRGPDAGATPPAPVPVTPDAEVPTWRHWSSCIATSKPADLGSPLGPDERIKHPSECNSPRTRGAGRGRPVPAATRSARSSVHAWFAGRPTLRACTPDQGAQPTPWSITRSPGSRRRRSQSSAR